MKNSINLILCMRLQLLIIYFIFIPLVLFSKSMGDTREFYGKITSNGTGIAAVAVTDGVQITITDKKGNYTLVCNSVPEFIYISVPSTHKIPLKDGIPSFYKAISDKSSHKQRIDFKLEKTSTDENKHHLIVCADPQIAFAEELVQLSVATKDMKNMIQSEAINQPVYGIVCGDIISNISPTNPTFKDVIKQFTDTNIPFFYASGNHDVDIGLRSNEHSKKTYESNFGPRYYSFNRGKIHYVVLDDVFSTGRNYGYIGYLEEKQLSWLEQDLALIPKNSTVFVVLHIPTFSPEARKEEYEKEDIKKTLQNRRALYNLLSPFKTHILSGHEHYQENYIINEHIFEHVNSALSGMFWQSPYNSDGTPLGYTVYEIDGDQVNWHFKAIGQSKDVQFEVYPLGLDLDRPKAIIANVWNYDPSWKVYWYEDEVKMGEMTKYRGWDPMLVDYVKNNSQHFRYKYIGAGPTEHLFFIEPKEKDATVRIEVVDRFGNSSNKTVQNEPLKLKK